MSAFPATHSNLTALLACFPIDLTTFIRSVLYMPAFVLSDRLRRLDSFGGLFRLYSLSWSAYRSIRVLLSCIFEIQVCLLGEIISSLLTVCLWPLGSNVNSCIL